MLSLQSKYFFYENDNGLEGMKTRGKKAKGSPVLLAICLRVFCRAVLVFTLCFLHVRPLILPYGKTESLREESGECPRYKQQGQCSTVHVLLSYYFGAI